GMSGGSRRKVVRDTTKLKAVHRKRVLREGEASPPPKFDRARYPEKVLELARLGWQALLDSEFESVVIAGWMTSALARMGAPLDVLGAFGRIVEDEVRHVDLCSDVVWALGGTPTISDRAVPPFPGWKEDQQEEAEAEAIVGLTAFFCVGELVSNFLLRQAEMMASEPIATWALGEIVRDEAFHGPWGFETARLFVPAWSEERKKRLVARLLDECARLEKRLGGPLPPTAERPPTKAEEQLAALGLPGPAPLLAVFYQAIETQLVPRMKDLGVDLPLGVGQAS
ncbi:MAG TPA: hypothetical protein VMV18_10170, partial [bacterium]|nr:hypothetical protein [bacterium]